MESQWFTLANCPDLSNLIVMKRILKEDHIKWLLAKPWWHANHTVVNEKLINLCKGTHLVSLPCDSIEILKLIKSDPRDIKVIISNKENTVFTKMEESRCHDNADLLVETGMAKENHTGFALSNDGLWRYHSWAIDFDGKVIETTTARLVYIVVTIGET
jgi:hypothetical protein